MDADSGPWTEISEPAKMFGRVMFSEYADAEEWFVDPVVTVAAEDGPGAVAEVE